MEAPNKDYTQELISANNFQFDVLAGEDTLYSENTRIQVLENIRKWIDEGHQPIFLLKGFAGCGKTTIAQNVAQEYRVKPSHAMASYCFSQACNLKDFAPTIARQLCERFQPFRNALSKSLNCDLKHIVNDRSLTDAWRTLIIDPLSNLRMEAQFRLIIVIDALDECRMSCSGPHEFQKIIEALADLSTTLFDRVHVRILVTSRSEKSISFPCETQSCVLHHIPPEAVENDIQTFIKTNFKANSFEARDQDIHDLAKMAGGLFLFAAEASKYVTEGRESLRQTRLSKVLDRNETSPPKQCLDVIYSTIIRSTVSEQSSSEKGERERLCADTMCLFGQLAVLFSPHALDLDSLSRIIQVEQLDVDLNRAAAIIDITGCYDSIIDLPKDGSRPLRIHHPYFADFLFRHTELFGTLNFPVSYKEAHKTMVENCLKVMLSSLKQDMCGHRDPCIPITHMRKDLLLADLQYACRYWAEHLMQTGIFSPEQHSSRLHSRILRFLEKHFIHWLEVMGILGLVSEAINSIAKLKCLCTNRQLTQFLRDANRFTLRNRNLAETTPLQLYSSGLMFCPKNSILRTKLQHDIWHGCSSWNPEAEWPSELQTLETDSIVTSVALSASGQFVASGSNCRKFKLWNPQTGELVDSPEISLVGFPQPDHSMKCPVTFSPDSRLLALAWGNAVMLWETHTRKSTLNLEEHECEVLSLAFSQDGKLLASGSCDSTVRLWSPITGKKLDSLEGHCMDVTSVAFSPETAILASGSLDKTVKIWDTSSGSLLHTFQAFQDLHGVSSVAFSHDGKSLASSYENGAIKVWDPKNHVELNSFAGHSGKATSLAFSPDNQFLASGSFDNTIKLWDLKRSQLCQTFEGHAHWVRSVAFSPYKGGQYITSGSQDKTVKIWKPGATDGRRHHQNAHSSSPVKFVVFSYDGKLLAASSGDHMIRIWEPSTGELQRTLAGHEYQISTLHFSLDPDNQLLASGSDDGKIRLWDITTDSSDPKFELNADTKVNSVAFSPEFRTQTLAAGYDGGTIRIWNFTMNQVLHTLSDPNPRQKVSSLAFSANGQMLASGSRNIVRLWTVKEGRLLHSVSAHRGPVESLSFSPDPSLILLASNSRDRVVRFWDCSEEKLAEHKLGKEMKDHSRFIWRGRNSGVSLESSRWIYFQGRRHLWLPWEYRESCLALKGDVLALGSANGHVSFITIPGLCDEEIS